MRTPRASRRKEERAPHGPTHQHDHTPVEDPPVVAVAAGGAQEGLLQDVAAAEEKGEEEEEAHISVRRSAAA